LNRVTGTIKARSQPGTGVSSSGSERRKIWDTGLAMEEKKRQHK